MPLNFIPPTKDTLIKVISQNVAFYLGTTASAAKLGKMNPAKGGNYLDWVVGDSVKATGNVLQNTEGTWVEATFPKWEKKNFLSQWRIVLATIYYRVEDNTATWVSDSVLGTKPPTTGSVGGTGTGTADTETPAPKEDTTTTNNNLAYAGIAIGILGLLTRKN